jgi:hypothetical protein
MFHVENADFIADKLAAELLPNQEYREVLKNALEAVERRMRAEGVTDGWRIEFDVDWSLHTESEGSWYLACSDNGDGMSRSQLEKYTTTLAVEGAGRNQSLRGNQGMGLKISGPTRHKRGLIIRSWKGNERTSVQIGWDGREYGLIPIGTNDELVVSVSEKTFPELVTRQQSGSVVTFLGNADKDNTFVPAGKPRGWLFRYLNSRFFRLSHDGIEVLVRVPSGDEAEWPHTAQQAAERMRKQGGKSFNLTMVKGTGQIWDEASSKLGEDFHGVQQLAGDVQLGIPPARVHWWVLPTGPGTDISSRTVGGGSISVLYQNELHDWRSSNQANPYFARLGVLFGKSRFAFVLEPEGTNVTSDFARAHVLVSGIPVFENEAWLVWAEQFRTALPPRIRETMQEEQGKLETEDPDRVKRIRERLRDVMQLLRPRRFRRAQQGKVQASTEVLGAGEGIGNLVEFPMQRYDRPTRNAGRARGIGALLSQIDESAGEPAIESSAILNLEPRWVTEAESDEFPVVAGNANGLRDRAAALAGADGRTANILLLNKEFRGFQAILAAVNEWANAEGDDLKATKIEQVAMEWVEQKMIEAIMGLRQLENGKTWITSHYDEGLSPVALTAAFMADRFHTLAEVKRAAGSMRGGRQGMGTEHLKSA